MMANRTEVLQLINEALNQLGDSERDSLRARALVVKAKALSSDQPDEAIRTFSEALRLEPSQNEARYHLAGLYAERAQPARALAVLEEIPDEDLTPPFLAMQARIRGMLQDTTAAAELIERARSEPIPPEHRQGLLLDLCEIALEIGRRDIADELLEEASGLGETFALSALQGRSAAAAGNFEVGAESYERAIATAPPAAKRAIRTELAAMLLRAKRPAAAADVLLPMPEGERSEVANKVLARSLYSSGQYAKAAEIVERPLSQGEPAGWLLELAGLLALRRDDLRSARAYFDQLLALDATDSTTTIRLAQILLRLGDEEAAQAALQRLSSSALSAIEKVQVAQLRAMSGLPGVLELAYGAVRQDPHDPDLQLAYINLFLQREDDLRELEPEEIAADTAVTLKDIKSGEVTRYAITSFPPLPGRGEELPPTDGFAKRLIGLRVGDTIRIREGTLTEGELVVEAVHHAFVDMFQWLLRSFPTRNPEHVGLQAFKIGEQPGLEDFAPILRSVEARAETVESVYEMYEDKGLPLGFLANALGVSLKDVQDSLIMDPERWLRVQSGLPNDLTRSRRAAGVGWAQTIVLTLTALLTLERLGHLDLLEMQILNLVVPQSLLDEIHEEVQRLEQNASRGGAQTLGKSSAGFSVHETSPEALREEARRLKTIAEVLERAAEVKPRPLDALSEEGERIREAIGSSSFDAYSLCGSDVGILADDKGLLDLSRNERNAEAFSTYWLLVLAQEAGRIGKAAFHDAVISLIQWHYAFIPVSAELIYHALQTSGFQVDSRVLSVFERLSGSHSDSESSARVIAGLLRAVTLSPATGQLKAVASSAFERYLSERPIDESVHQLIRALQMHFSLLPEQFSELVEVLSSVEAAKRSTLMSDPD